MKHRQRKHEMSEKRFGKIRRSEFERRENEFQVAQTRCAVELRVPQQFATLARECAPTHAEACDFEKVRVEEVNENSGRDIAREFGWTRLGCGVGRCTYRWKPKCVVKFARSARRPTTNDPNNVVGYGTFNGVTGEESNTYEVAAYNLADEGVKKFLTPIIAHSPATVSHGYTWIVAPMARTEKNDGLNFDRMDSIRKEIRAGLDKAHAECEDIHYGNIGLLLDKYPVLIDYGFSVRCKRAQRGDIAKAPRKLSEFGEKRHRLPVEKILGMGDITKHRGRHGLKRPRGKAIPMGVLTQRRRILWAEAGALRRKAKQFTDPDVRERMVADARFLEKQAWAFQTKLGGGRQVQGKEYERMLGLLNQTRKEAFIANPI